MHGVKPAVLVAVGSVVSLVLVGCSSDAIPPIAFGRFGPLSGDSGRGSFRFGVATAATQIVGRNGSRRTAGSLQPDAALRRGRAGSRQLRRIAVLRPVRWTGEQDAYGVPRTPPDPTGIRPMIKKPVRKFQLSRETLRVISNENLTKIGGGYTDRPTVTLHDGTGPYPSHGDCDGTIIVV